MLALYKCVASQLCQALFFGDVCKLSCDVRQFLDLQREVILNNYLIDSRLCVVGTHYLFPRALDGLG